MLNTFPSIAQSPYQLCLKKDTWLLGTGIGGMLLGGLTFNTVDAFSEDAINNLNPLDINSFDRNTINYYSSTARNQSDILLFSSLTYPLLLLLNKPIRSDFLPVGIMGLEVLALNASLTTLTKGLIKRTRPFVYNPTVSLETKITSNARASFFSGHTSNVAAMSFFTAKVITDYYPNSKWKPVIWSAAVLLPATTGYLRVRGGKHFPTDVMTGFVTGALWGILIPEFHKKTKKDKKVSLSFLASNTDIGLKISW